MKLRFGYDICYKKPSCAFYAEFLNRITIKEIAQGVNDRRTTRSMIFRPCIKRKISNTARGAHPWLSLYRDRGNVA